VSKNNHYSKEMSWNSDESPISKKMDRYSILIDGEKEEESGLTSGRRQHANIQNFSQCVSDSSNIQEALECDFPQNLEIKQAQLKLFHASIKYHPEEIYNLWQAKIYKILGSSTSQFSKKLPYGINFPSAENGKKLGIPQKKRF
jgi:hypothetical protein